MHILIIDDDRAARRAAEAKLVFEGHVVHGPAATASEAFAIASEVDLDVVIVDTHLRDGQSGAAVAASPENNGLPVIVTAHAIPSLAVFGRASHGVLRKPYPVMALARAVRFLGDHDGAVLKAGDPRPQRVATGLH